MLKFLSKQVVTGAAVLLLLLHLTTQMFAAVVAPPCLFTPTNITVQGPGVLGFTSSVMPTTYVPNGTLNGAPKWENANFGTFPYRLVWTGTVWKFREMFNGIPVVIVAQNNTGSATMLSCAPSGWQDPNDEGYFNPGQLTLGGGCGSLLAPTVTLSVSIAADPSNSVPDGTPVTFTASPTNGGDTPAYQWYKNGVAVGTDSPTYEDALLQDGDETKKLEGASSYPTAFVEKAVAHPNENFGYKLVTTSGPGVTCPNEPTVYSVTGGGFRCSNAEGLPIGLSSSEVGVEYQLYYEDAPIDGVTFMGTGAAFEFSVLQVDEGAYSILATEQTEACQQWMNGIVYISVDQAPAIFEVYGGGVYCPGGEVEIILSNTEIGVEYEIFKDGESMFVAYDGTGELGEFGVSPFDEDGTGNMVVGNYTILAIPISNGCMQFMSGSADVTLGEPVPTSVFITATPGNSVPDGTPVTFTATPTNGGDTPAYQWYKNGVAVGTDSPTYEDALLQDGDEISLEMTSSDPCASPATVASNVIVIEIVNTCLSNAATWVGHPTQGSAGWNSVTYGNGLFVAVSPDPDADASELIMTSPDGVNWTNRTAPGNSIWRSVTYGNGLFVAVADAGDSYVMTSPDGINWTARAAEENPWRSVTYGNGLFVAVGDNSVMTSPDGINWASQTAAEENQWSSVTYGGGLFVAVAFNGDHRVMTSPDGINWTSRVAPEASWISVTYGDGLFVAVSVFGENQVMTSPDGTTWTGQMFPDENPFGAVTYGNGLFVAIEYFGGQVLTSSDGTNWTFHDDVEYSLWVSATYANGIFVAVAFGGDNLAMSSSNSVVPAEVSITADPGNSISAGTEVTFTAIPTNGGSTPSYQWKVNGNPVGTDQDTYTSTTLADGDEVTCEMTSNDPCADPVLATSNGITMTVTTPCPPGGAPLPMFTGLGANYCELDAAVTLTGNMSSESAYFSGPGITDNGDGTATFLPANAVGTGTVRYLSTINDCTAWTTISGGVVHSVALQADGTLWAWGGNTYGQLGNGTFISENIPVRIGNNHDWADIAVGYNSTIALKTDGTLWAWGLNDLGQLGNGTTTNSNIPVQIGMDNDWVHISSKGDFTIALKSNGTLWAWGYNGYGQLGNGNNSNSIVPVQVGTDNDWATASTGIHHSLALKTNGTFWAWGGNTEGQLGNGTNNSTNTPIQIGTDTDWDQIVGGVFSSYAIKTNGSLWAWGYNNFGQLGIGNNTNTNTPTQVGSDTDWEILVSKYACHALKSNGTLWAWGRNFDGELGNGTYNNVNTPEQIGTDSDWTRIGTGYWHTFAIKDNGDIYTTGWNDEGQLGDATQVSKNQFGKMVRAVASVQVTVEVCLEFEGLDSEYCSGDAPVTLTGNYAPAGTFSGPGITDNGDGTATFDPATAGTGGTVSYSVNSGTAWASVSAGYYHSMGIKTDGTLWGWGYNSYGGLGNGTYDDTTVPVQSGTDNNWASVSAGYYHSLGVKTDGTLWGWGYNDDGELGSLPYYNPDPVNIFPGNNWAKVEAGYYVSFGIKTDGTLWAWGYNGYGLLGNGTYSGSTTPVQVGTATNWASVSTNSEGENVLAVRTDGTLWGWGDNSSGQLGDGTTDERLTPVQVGTATNWSFVESGYYHTIGLRSDGTLWGWGYNGYGELGNGTYDDTNVPVQIGTDTDWSKAAAGYYCTNAVKTDGTLWGWGYNGDGELGNGTYDDTNVPVQSGTETGWANVSASYGAYGFGLKSDGNLFGWGYNYSGYIGDGTYDDTNVPVQVGEPVVVVSTYQTVTVSPSLLPDVSIAANPGNSITAGTPVTFTATPTNGGATPTYQWKKNNTNVGMNSPTYVDNALTDGDEIMVEMTSTDPCANPATATSNKVTMTVTLAYAPSCYKIQVSTSCSAFNGEYLYAGDYLGGGYWAKSDNPNLEIWFDGNSWVIWDYGSYLFFNSMASLPLPPTIGWLPWPGNACDGMPITNFQLIPLLQTPTVTIVANPGSTIASGTSVTFTATPVNGGATPSYQWKKNNTNVGINSPTYMDNALTDGDEIMVEMTSNAPCASPTAATSNKVTMTVTLAYAPSCYKIQVSTSCSAFNGEYLYAGDYLGGGYWAKSDNPNLEIWFDGNSWVIWDYGSYLFFNSMASLPLPPTIGWLPWPGNACDGMPITNFQLIPLLQTPTVTIVANPGNSISSGTPVTFTATPINGGTLPSYQWKKNNANVGMNSPTYTDATLADGDVITVEMTSSDPCASPTAATSNAITMTVIPPCPSLSNAPDEVQITNSICSSCTLSGGSISAPAGMPCPTGSSIQYSTDGGLTWDNNLPVYNQEGPVQTIQTRCICDANSDVFSPASAGVTTEPGTCTPVTAIIDGNPTVCGGATLTASGGDTYEWSGGSTPNQAENFFAVSDTYTVTVTGANGCTDAESIEVVTNIPNVYTTNITGCGSYTWAVNGQTYTQPGTYTVTVSACEVQVLNLTIPPGQIVSLNGNTTVCAGGIIGLVATGGNQYQWSGPNSYTATGGSITRNNAATTMSGVYTVTITNNTCVTVLSTTVTVYAIPTVAISGSSSFCAGSTITLSATAGASNYAWSGPGGFTQSGAEPTLSRPGANSTMAGTYTVTITNANGCTATASRSISITAAGTVSITGGPTFCTGNSMTLTTAAVGATYAWSGPGGFTFTGGATMTRNPAVAGTYTVTVTTAAGCTSSGSRSVTVNASPNATITNHSTCTRIYLIASGGNSYQWSGPNGFTISGTTVNRNNPTATMWGTYTVTITSNGCTSIASVTVSPCGANKNAGEELTLSMAVYPNPTGNISNISFYAYKEEAVTLQVFAADGKEIAVLFNQTTQPDTAYNVVFDAAQLPNGTYYAILRHADGSQETLPVLVVK